MNYSVRLDLWPEFISYKVNHKASRNNSPNGRDMNPHICPSEPNIPQKEEHRNNSIRNRNNKVDHAVVDSTPPNIEWFCKPSTKHCCPQFVDKYEQSQDQAETNQNTNKKETRRGKVRRMRRVKLQKIFMQCEDSRLF